MLAVSALSKALYTPLSIASGYRAVTHESPR